jgi:hypothetical protein
MAGTASWPEKRSVNVDLYSSYPSILYFYAGKCMDKMLYPENKFNKTSDFINEPSKKTA